MDKIRMGSGDGDTEDETQASLDLGIAASNATLRADNQLGQKNQNYGNQSMTTLRLMDEVTKVLQHQSYGSEVKLLMFAAASHCDGYRSTLVPIPSLFMGDAFYDIDQLRGIVSSWPSCSQMLERLCCSERHKHLAETGMGHIYLLHWVLVTQSNPDLRRVCSRRLRRLCREMHLLRPPMPPDQLLRVSYKDETPATKPNRRFAYLGCPLHMLHRLLIMRDLAGPIRLFDQPEAALVESTSSSCNGWTHSRFGLAPRCVLICELLEQQQPRSQQSFVCDSSMMRVRYLMFFSDKPEASGFPPRLVGGTNRPKRRGLLGGVRWLVRRALQVVQFQPPVYY